MKRSEGASFSGSPEKAEAALRSSDVGRATLSDSSVERVISASSGSNKRRERRKTAGSTLILEMAMPTFVDRFPSKKVT